MLSTTLGINGNGYEGIDKRPCNLYFPRDDTNGRSAFHSPKIDANVGTTKVYSKPIETKHIYDISETVNATVEDGEKRRDIWQWPLLNSESYGWWYDHAKVGKEIDESIYDRYPLSSESYGWWYDRAFSSREPRIDDHIRDPTLVQSSEIIHWQDQKLFSLGHSSYA